MNVDGIGTAGYPVTGYQAKRAERNVSSGALGFVEKASEKAGWTEEGYDEKAFASVGANAPTEVKKAWMEAAMETGVNGLGMNGKNGMLTHISKMMVQRLNKLMKGTCGENDILGSTVQSAIRATEQALFDLDHPLLPEGLKSIEVQRHQMKERMFYQSFLEKLGALVNGGFAEKAVADGQTKGA